MIEGVKLNEADKPKTQASKVQSGQSRVECAGDGRKAGAADKRGI